MESLPRIRLVDPAKDGDGLCCDLCEEKKTPLIEVDVTYSERRTFICRDCIEKMRIATIVIDAVRDRVNALEARVNELIARVPRLYAEALAKKDE